MQLRLKRELQQTRRIRSVFNPCFICGQRTRREKDAATGGAVGDSETLAQEKTQPKKLRFCVILMG